MVYTPFVLNPDDEAEQLPPYIIDTSEMLVVFTTGNEIEGKIFQANFDGGK